MNRVLYAVSRVVTVYLMAALIFMPTSSQAQLKTAVKTVKKAVEKTKAAVTPPAKFKVIRTYKNQTSGMGIKVWDPASGISLAEAMSEVVPSDKVDCVTAGLTKQMGDFAQTKFDGTPYVSRDSLGSMKYNRDCVDYELEINVVNLNDPNAVTQAAKGDATLARVMSQFTVSDAQANPGLIMGAGAVAAVVIFAGGAIVGAAVLLNHVAKKTKEATDGTASDSGSGSEEGSGSGDGFWDDGSGNCSDPFVLC